MHFLGFRKDVYRILKASDIFIFPSYREGLSVALTEAMACGLPVVASRIRGNIDLIDENLGGLLCNPSDVKTMAMHIDTLATNYEIRHRMGLYNYEKSKKYDKNIIIRKLMAMILEQVKKNDENSVEQKIKLENKTNETAGIKGDA